MFFRKGGLLLNNILGVGGGCLMGFTKISNSYEMLFFGRFIIGVNCGKSLTSCVVLVCVYRFCHYGCKCAFVSRFKYVFSTYVYIGNRAFKLTWRFGHGKSISCDCRTFIISSAWNRADPRDERRLAPFIRARRLSRLITTRTTASLSRKSEILAHYQAVGRRSEESVEKAESEQSSGRGYRGDESRRKSATGGIIH